MTELTRKVDSATAKGKAKMKCVHCGGRVYVLATELRKHDILVYRRRECQKCGRRFSTYEITIDDYQHMKESAAKLDILFDKLRRT